MKAELRRILNDKQRDKLYRFHATIDRKQEIELEELLLEILCNDPPIYSLEILETLIESIQTTCADSEDVKQAAISYVQKMIKGITKKQVV
jgi:hypothetical protein